MKFVTVVGLCLFSLNSWGAPQIIYSGANILELRHRDSVTFSLVVSDPAGLENLAGAVLIDVTSKATYGSFQAGARKGAYQISLSYEQFEKVRPVHPEPVTGEKRAVQALVFNSNGESAHVEFSVGLISESRYSPLAQDVFVNLPLEWQSHFNEKWINYIGSQEFSDFISIAVTFDQSTGTTRVQGSVGTRWNPDYTKVGKQAYDEVISACKRVDATLQDRHYGATCTFNIRCIRPDSMTQPICWRYYK